MTFTALRSLYALIGEALDDIERIYRDADAASPAPTSPYTYSNLTSPTTPFFQHRHSPQDENDRDDDHSPQSAARSPKTPRRRTTGNASSIESGADSLLDFPSLDTPYYPTEDHDLEANTAESLASHPDVIAATNRIVAACGQISASVHRPFLTLCDAAMGYHLPACLRFLEASHMVEILRAAGPKGMHVRELSNHVNVDEDKLGHILRLLATHHITREVRPNVFANNRISAIMDSGRQADVLKRGAEDKYVGTNGIAAFVNLCTDELFKSSSYLADCYLPSLSGKSGTDKSAMHAPFNVAFNTDTPYFEWLERPGNEARLSRFGPAMTGTAAWEIPGAIVTGFPWNELKEGSLVVDVGGGIGSTAMLLAHTFPHLRFMIQDRPSVAEHGITAWRERCPEMLDSGRAVFLGHDFFVPQPPLVMPGSTKLVPPAVYILRVVTHDWPDSFVTKILLNLRRAATPDTKLLLADHILPHACIDDENDDLASDGQQLPGKLRSLAPEGSPLLPNLGKAHANAYWLDLTMRVTFNAQERTLREMVVLAASAGWKVSQFVHGDGSLFSHITAVPVAIPEASLALLNEPAEAAAAADVKPTEDRLTRSASVVSRTGSIRMDGTFGQTSLPTDRAMRQPARKSKRPFLPWWRNKSAPDSQARSNGTSSGNVRKTSTEGDASKPSKGARRPRLSILTPQSTANDKPRDRAGSSVGILSSSSAPDEPRSSSNGRAPQPSPLTFTNPSPEGDAAMAVPPSPLLPSPPLEPGVKARSSGAKSLRKRASQVFGLRRGSQTDASPMPRRGSDASLRASLAAQNQAAQPVPPVPAMPDFIPPPTPRSTMENARIGRVIGV